MKDFKTVDNFDEGIHLQDYKSKYERKMCTSKTLLNIEGRNIESLNGQWNFMVDPYDTLIRARWLDSKEKDSNNRNIPLDFDFNIQPTHNVPSCWNTEDPSLLLYENSAIYKRDFNYIKNNNDRCFLHFEGAQYRTYVFLNKEYIATHDGGSTPFSVEITGEVKEDNEIIVVVDAKRDPSRVPMDNTDWFNYGGLYRDVSLLRLPTLFIKDYFISLVPNSNYNKVRYSIYLNTDINGIVTVSIDELDSKCDVQINKGYGEIELQLKPKLWSPESPKLYDVKLSYKDDIIIDKIGFREIKTDGNNILLNGQKRYLKGISVHEDHLTLGKCESEENVRATIKHLKEMNGNYLRLAHYPHSRIFSKIADEEGILLWEEVPVYWAIDFTNPKTLADALNQLSELVIRDRNRASVIIWSVGNENADSDERLSFMSELVDRAKELDDTRCISAACLVNQSKLMIEDRLADKLDIIGLNEYFGWYDPDFSKLPKLLENSNPIKPIIITEFGGGVLACNHGSKDTLWTEEYQEELYKMQFKTMKECKFIQGTTPWILYDFRCERRYNAYQKGFNRKGVISSNHKTKKKAFYVISKYYETIK